MAILPKGLVDVSPDLGIFVGLDGRMPPENMPLLVFGWAGGALFFVNEYKVVVDG